MAKFALRIRYVEPHGNAWRYRRFVPHDVRDQIGRKRWVKTFPSQTLLSRIEREAKRLAMEHDREIAIARARELSPDAVAKAEAQARDWLTEDKAQIYELLNFFLSTKPDDGLSPEDTAFINAVEHGGRYIPESLSLTAALERDTRLYGQGRDPKPLQCAADSFVALIGDKPVTSVSRGDVAEWLAAQTNKGLAPATIKRRLGALRAVVNRAFLDFDHNARNPFERHKIKGGDGGANDRLPFNLAMLERIDSYLASNRQLGHETRNILRIMRNTGGGPAEVGGLAVTDVSLDSDVPYVWIRQNALRGVKAEARDRQVPLIGYALEAAQDAYKRATVKTKGIRKSPDKTPLFGSFGINGRGADSISAKLNKAIRTAGVPRSPRLTAYSFRHTIKEAMRSAGTLNHVQDRIMGHSGEGRISARYGSPRARLKEAYEALERALEHLGDVDPSIYSARERFKN